MKNTKREFIINELMVEHFIEKEGHIIHLEETEDSGKSILEFQVVSHENLCIRNVDFKNTLLQFIQIADLVYIMWMHSKKVYKKAATFPWGM